MGYTVLDRMRGHLAQLLRSEGSRTKWLLAWLAVVGAVGIAFAFWQSSEFSDEANDLVETARYAQVEHDQWQSTIRARLDRTFQVVRRCVMAGQLSDEARNEYEATLRVSHLAEFIEQELRRVASEGQIPDQGSCDSRNVPAVFELEEFLRASSAEAPSPQVLIESTASLRGAEGHAIRAAVAFAFALLAVAVAQHARDGPRFGAFIFTATLFLVSGVGLLIAAFVAVGRPPSWVWAGALLGSIGLLVWLSHLVTSAVRVGMRGASGNAMSRAIAIPPERLTVTAEILGALAIVALAMAAWGFAASTAQQRESIRVADSFSSETGRALELGVQSTLALLDHTGHALDFEARWAAEVRAAEESGSETAPIIRVSEQWDEQLMADWEQDRCAWEQLARQLSSEEVPSRTNEEDCAASSLGGRETMFQEEAPLAAPLRAMTPAPRKILGQADEGEDDDSEASDPQSDGATGQTGPSTDSAEASTGSNGEQESCLDGEAAAATLPWISSGLTPATVLIDSRLDPQAVPRLLGGVADASIRCSVAAGVRSQEAIEWGDRALRFAVAIVVLGTAGFILALAADSKWPYEPRVWLLASGVIGLFAGIAFALLTALLSVPTSVAERDLRVGSVAYAQAQRSLLWSDCATAEREAVEAVKRLPDFAPAHLLLAESVSCDPRFSWLFGARLADPAAFETSLNNAMRLDESNPAITGNLGWLYLHNSILGGTDRANALDRAADLTGEALAADEGNLFFCFNWALSALVGGDVDAPGEDIMALHDEAVRRYTAALDMLRQRDAACHGDTPQTAGTPDSAAARDPGIQAWMRLLALADLELFGAESIEEYDEFRELILNDFVNDGSNDDAPPIHGWAEVPLLVFPHEIQLGLTRGEESFGTPFSAVWYYRGPEDEQWSVIVDPTLATFLEQDDHRGIPWPTGALLPDGHYRADLYVDGRLVHRVETESKYWESKALDPSDFELVEVADIGVTVAVPERGRSNGWEPQSSDWNGQIEFAGHDGSLSVRRWEGANNEDFWSELDLLGVADVVESDDPAYRKWLSIFESFDLGYGLEEGGRYIGLGHRSYTPPSQLLGNGDLCPGTMLVAEVVANNNNVAEVVRDSFRFDHDSIGEFGNEKWKKVIDNLTAGGSFNGPAFSLQFPPDWTVDVPCMGRFAALAPDEAANLLVGSEPLAGTLTEYVDSQIQILEQEFPEFLLVDRVAREQSIEITFESTHEPGRIRQTQAYHQFGETVYFLTFSSLSQDAELYQEELRLFLDSFEPRSR